MMVNVRLHSKSIPLEQYWFEIQDDLGIIGERLGGIQLHKKLTFDINIDTAPYGSNAI